VALVAVHDGARPFASAGLFARVIDAARATGAACAALPCHETIKEVDAGGTIRRTADRARLWAAQTPQVFARDRLAALLAEAAAAGVEVTDDSALFDAHGIEVRAVAGERTNLKITTPEDLPLAEAIAAGARDGGREPTVSGAPRVGSGFDIHRLVDGRQLVVCGVELASDRGAEGHSDADVGAHAIIDALLGAAAAGDIGALFPDTDPAYEGADSMRLLAEVGRRLRAGGFAVCGIDVTVFLARPAIRPHLERMRRRIVEATDAPFEAVSVKGKTMNGLGPVGEGLAAAAQATAVLERGPRAP
jgi:2-C-methyl-D-erythritol 4-phosphate cytidylyltransferase/2-C-methyl-D-erythritol 2,4-cyclodiphosphate synthase